MHLGQKSALLGLVSALLLSGAASPASATSMVRRNVADLIELSETILVGRVTAVTDGFENGVPYTEITLSVREAIRGDATDVYTFRQFGLTAPRDLGNGLTYVGISPAGWPRYHVGDAVVLFLYRPAAQTGLRATVGLLQGTFTLRGGEYRNGIDNEGLFRNVRAPGSELTPSEREMLRRPSGGIPAETFVSFVRKAVRNRWVENGELSHVR